MPPARSLQPHWLGCLFAMLIAGVAFSLGILPLGGVGPANAYLAFHPPVMHASINGLGATDIGATLCSAALGTILALRCPLLRIRMEHR